MAKKNGFDELSFNLYKEALGITHLTAHIYEKQNESFERNQAVCVGLIVRISKFMTVVVQLASSSNRREVIMALNRSIMESAVNLKYLVLKNKSDAFDEFIKTSLGPERELFNLIQKNFKERGEMLPIEQRMLNSIERVCRLSNVNINEIESKHKSWGGNLRQRLSFLGEETMYLSIQRLPSHSVHGSWVDLLLHHLEEKEDGFGPVSEWGTIDPRILSPIAIYVLDSIVVYLTKSYDNNSQTKIISDRIVDLKARLVQSEEAHELSFTKIAKE